MTRANFTDTVEVPSNQTVAASKSAGAVVTWATPYLDWGSLQEPDTGVGITFPRGQTAVTCQVVDGQGNVATGTVMVTVSPPLETTSVFFSSNGAVLAGPYLDAGGLQSGRHRPRSLQGQLANGLTDQVVATVTSTLYCWLAQWNSTTVPNGTKAAWSVWPPPRTTRLQQEHAGFAAVDNPLPTTTSSSPQRGRTLSGLTYLDASASNTTAVKFLLFGGSYGYAAPRHSLTATSTLYGWSCGWNITTVPITRTCSWRRPSNSAGTAYSRRQHDGQE